MAGELSVFAPTAGDTNIIGAALAGILVPGDLLLLEGGLGAGKSALARSVLRTLLDDAKIDVPSPSFLLVLPYRGNGWSLVHADLYRLQAGVEVEELGLLEQGLAVTLVEWPDRAPELRADADFYIEIDLPDNGDGRFIRIAACKKPLRLVPLADALKTYENKSAQR